MAYIPSSDSVVAFQSKPSSLLVGASVIGLTPVAPTPSSVMTIQGTTPWVVGSVAVNLQSSNASIITVGGGTTGNSSVTAFQGGAWTVSVVGNMNSSVTSFQGGTWITSVVNTVPSSLLVGASVIGTVPVTQTTSPWVINMPSPSVIMYQAAGSVLAVSATVNTGNSSVQLLGGVAAIGSVATLQGTNPWVVTTGNSSVMVYIPGSVAVAGNLSANISSASVVQQGTWIVSVVNTVPSSLLVGASIIGTVPVTGAMSIIGTVPVTQSGTWVTSVVNTIPSSLLVGASIIGRAPISLYFPNGTAVNDSGGNLMVNVGNFATGQFGNVDSTAPDLTSALVFSENLLYNKTDNKYDRWYGTASTGALVQTGNSSVITTLASIGTAGGRIPITGTASVQLLAGVNPIGSVAVLQGTNPWLIGNSSVMTIQGTTPWVIGSIAGTYAEDAGHTSGDQGLFMLAVRNDTMASTASADLDYTLHAVGPVGETLVANAPITKWVSGATSVMYGTSVLVLAAPGASIFTYITGIHVMNESANVSRVTITQGLGRVPASMVTWAIAPATGGSNMNFPNPLRVLDNNSISASISGISSVFVTITGFTSKT